MNQTRPQNMPEEGNIKNIFIDLAHLVAVSSVVERECEQSRLDLMKDGMMQLKQPALRGPYQLSLKIAEQRQLIFKIIGQNNDQPQEALITMSLTPLRKVIKDYLRVCENYYDALKNISPVQIEPIDMARRGLHNEGSELLKKSLETTITMNDNTARRFFTLICALHIHG